MHKMTVEVISDNVRRWLCYRVFPDKQDIVQLQQLSGGSVP